MSTATFILGDVFDAMTTIEPRSIDVIGCSPPFLALRSYLPDDHPDKHKEIGTEATPLEFMDTLLALTERWGELLTPTGSIFVELGDTHSGSGGSGGDYSAGGLRDGQPTVKAARKVKSRSTIRPNGVSTDNTPPMSVPQNGGAGWPLPKSLVGIPHLYHLSLVYGRNLLRAPLTARQLLEAAEGIVNSGAPVDARALLDLLTETVDEHGSSDGYVTEFEPWIVRNVIAWCRPNPSVGELGDKFRPATSYITIATRSPRRYFDVDAVRSPLKFPEAAPKIGARNASTQRTTGGDNNRAGKPQVQNDLGAPPHDDWWIDDQDVDGCEDWGYDLFEQDAWMVPTQPYKGQHYATWPKRLIVRLIDTMCPRQVCTICGEPRRRVIERSRQVDEGGVGHARSQAAQNGGPLGAEFKVTTRHVGWSHCECGDGCTPSKVVKRTVRTDPELSPDGVVINEGYRTTEHVVIEAGECNDPTHWRRGLVLDPFGGSGTTGLVATGLGRDCTLIDIDSRNLDLARERVGMFLQEHPVHATTTPTSTAPETKGPTPPAPKKRPASKPKAKK